MEETEPSELSAILGQPMTLKCNLPHTYHHNVEVLWKHNLQPLHFDGVKRCGMDGHYCLNAQLGSLMIAVLQPSDHGMYSCYSKSPSHLQGNNIHLNVHGMPLYLSFFNPKYCSYYYYYLYSKCMYM